MEYSLSSSERPILPVCYRVPHRFQGEVAKEIYWERKFSKKQRWRQFLSPRASKTTEWQHGDSWDTVCSPLNTSMTNSGIQTRVIIVIYRWFTLIFDAELVLFYAWVEGKRRLSSFWLPTHQAVCTGSRVSFKQAGSVNEAAGHQIHLFSCKTTSSLALVAMTGR